eukprot:jgi/Astpho2/2037/e_gw1.00038.287.1_t
MSSAAGPAALTPKCFLIVHNISKRHNVGTLARSATAFGVSQLCLVGSKHFNTFGSHGAYLHVNMRHFEKLEQCCQYLKEEQGCAILGVEITDDAKPVQSQPFQGNTAFMVGNEGDGLSEKQMALCDSFVYIPQYGEGTASLNVTVAASIVLHNFAVWAQFSERQRSGYKYDVAVPPPRTTKRGGSVVPCLSAPSTHEQLPSAGLG